MMTVSLFSVQLSLFLQFLIVRILKLLNITGYVYKVDSDPPYCLIFCAEVLLFICPQFFLFNLFVSLSFPVRYF